MLVSGGTPRVIFRDAVKGSEAIGYDSLLRELDITRELNRW